jgi:hypothetical protein
LFTSAWRAATVAPGKATAIVKGLGPPPATGGEWPAELAVLDLERLAKFVARFRPAVGGFLRRGERFNVWQAALLGRDERRNCNVLSTFLDHRGQHGQGAEILVRLLVEIGLGQLAERARQCRYDTRTEAWPLGDGNSRIDIEVEGDDFLVFVEVKIGASETRDQLRRYRDLAYRKAARREWVVLYLTPDRRGPIDPTLCDDSRIKRASWKDVAEAVRSCVRDKEASPIHHLLLRYAEFIQDFT